MVLQADICVQRPMYSVQPARKRLRLKPTHTSLIVWHVLALVYYFYNNVPCCNAAQSTNKVRLVDLSHTFDENTIYWVTAKKLDFTVTHNGTDPGKNYWYQAEEIAAGTHGGTHLDSPCHFAFGRWCVSDIPMEHLVAPAAVVDISHYVGEDPNVHLSLDHLTEWEKMHGQVPDGSILLVRTGWSRFWPDKLTYTGTTERNVDLLKFPSIKPEVAEWLASNRIIVGIGIDVMSIDKPIGMKEVHRTLMDKNIYGLENVNMVEAMPPTGVKLYVMPMKLRNASGAPCRILAEVPEGVTNGNVSSSSSVSLIWTVAIAVLWTIKNLRF